jgi:DNA-binding response OmpR family regulator
VRMMLVEDDDQVVEALVPALSRRGFTVDRLAEGREVLDRLVGIDVVLLDLRLPDMDGVALCRRIRAISDVPIIVVSALGDFPDRILGLHAGADDYIVKPYDEGELVARVYAVLRRGAGAHPPVGTTGEMIAVGDVEIHLSRHQVLVAGQEIPLSRKQFQVLALVAEAGGAVCTRERIMVEVWRDYAVGQEPALDDHVRQVRAALDRSWVLETVYDVGYRLGRPPASVPPSQAR